MTREEHPLEVLGSFLLVGLLSMLIVAGARTRDDSFGPCTIGEPDEAILSGETACRNDYAPAPPANGSWCGVRLDDRYPVRDDSFPTIETATASSP